MKYKVGDKVTCIYLESYEEKNGHAIGDTLTICETLYEDDGLFLALENKDRNRPGRKGNYWMMFENFEQYKAISRRKLDIVFEETL